MHRVTNGRLQHEMLVKAASSEKEGRKAIDATAGMGEDAFTGCTGVRGDII